MSGPKVVRIVTREEIIAICEGHLQRLERAVDRWQTQATRLGELSEQERSAFLERHTRLRALLAEDRLAELQKAVPVEIEHLHRDLEDREERAIIRAAERRQRDRRVQENAETLLDALQANPESVDQALLESLSRLASGASREDAERLLAEGFGHLSKANEEPTLSDTQRALAQQLKLDEPELSCANGLRPGSRMQRATYGCYALTATSWSCNCCKALSVPRRSSWHWNALKRKPMPSGATCCSTA